MDVQPGSRTRLADLSGTPDQISRAEQLISDVFAEADAGSFGTISSCVEQFQMQIANNKFGCALTLRRGACTVRWCGGLRRWGTDTCSLCTHLLHPATFSFPAQQEQEQGCRGGSGCTLLN
ncbi:uncharacterized protein LOC125552889 isoform X2 [Triticum urartu]|uniref:uncharacterized protein LOC125552889 isoform X2 n=1 Tax=Triticum urartu TaxID=4572 RepID=UPI002042F4C0|nr:uncharacterized protein LOC125552889 isoform X2 [Triticum urartu]